MNLLSAKELSVHLSVSEWTVKRAYRARLIPGERLGKLLRFDLEAVREAMREQGQAEQDATVNGSVRIGESRPRRAACAQIRRSTGNSVPKTSEEKTRERR